MNRHLLVAATALLLVGCAPTPDIPPTAPALPAATALPPVGGTIEAEGRVVPVQSAMLSLPVGGIVAELLVAEGDQVQANQPLLRLDQARGKAAVSQAQANLEAARSAYAQLRAGAQPEEVAIAEAQVTQAQAQLRQVQGGVTSNDIAAARAQVEQARATLARLESGPNNADLRQAQAGLDQAQAGAQSQRDSLSAAKLQAESQVEQAANQLRDRQAEYSRIYWENRQLADRIGDLPQANQDQEAAALRAVENAEQQLEQARLALSQAQQAEISGSASAEAQVRDAQARLDRLQSGSAADQIAAARAQLVASQANLEKLRGDQRGGSLDAAEAGVALAEANLARLRSGPAGGDLEVAAAEVQRAEASLTLAEVSLAETELRAPFAGTIAGITPQTGEYIAPGSALITLADLSSWQIETTDLTERNVVRINEDSPATIRFDALPDLELQGSVSQIQTIGESQQGDMTYVVTISLAQQNPRLRWNMTASVLIEQNTQE